MIKDKQLKEKIGIEIRQGILENRHSPVYLGIGSNIGNRLNNISKASYLLSNFCEISKISNFYETNSWPNKNYRKYLNVIIKCYTNLNPILLLKNIKIIEKKLGRVNKIKNYPRTCDIDIIDFKGLKYHKNNIDIPHPRLSERNFVLVPLYEIEKTWKHPKSNISIHNLLKNLDLNSLRGIKFF